MMSFLTWPLRCTWAHDNKDAAEKALQPPAEVTSNHTHNFKYLKIPPKKLKKI